jgi:dolichyl-phosphate beta-glucosyltransferase
VTDPRRVTIVIPAHNEAQRIGPTLRTIRDYLCASSLDAAVIVVDDGSTDDTATLAAQAVDSPRVRVIRLPANRGKGYAVRTGMAAADGTYVLVTDADLSTPIHEIAPLLRAVDEGADVAIGSRDLPQSNVVVHQPWWREHMGDTFNVCARALGLTSFHDTQCGFKLLRAADAKRLCRMLVVDGFAYDVELLLAARTLGLSVREMPVEWRHAEFSRVHPVRAPIAMLRDLVRIRLRAWRGRYRELGRALD